MRIVIDLFPSHFVAASPGTFDPITELRSQPAPRGIGYVSMARIVITEEVVVVAKDGPEGAQVVFQEAYDEPPIIKDGEYWLKTRSGKQLSFKKDTNCGCGSRLRSWNAYRTLTSIKDTQK